MFPFRELFHLIISQFSWAAVSNQSNSWLENFQPTLPCSEKGVFSVQGGGNFAAETNEAWDES